MDNDGELNVQEFMKGCQEDQVYYLYIQTGNITIIITSIKLPPQQLNIISFKHKYSGVDEPA